LTEHPQAKQLEQRARQLADAYWSETVWLTGQVPAAAFRAVCSVLEQESLIEPEAVTLIVAPVKSGAGGDEIGRAVSGTGSVRDASMEQGVIEGIDGQVAQLHQELARMTAYAKALEGRCHVLWAYVPGNQGQQDQIIPFLAEDLGITTTTAAQVEVRASHD
jgi:hypothetical protein